MKHLNADRVWLSQLADIFANGSPRAARKLHTLDLVGSHIVVDMMTPVVTVAERKLSYRFMAAEASWILSGSDKVSGIAPWNKNISQFSDDGVTFFGAYGPKIQDQKQYVIRKLREDPDTRQAGLTIWRENPPQTKDVPCTIAMFFSRRGTFLDSNVFMRSSDAWLGLPYDIFNFSMVTVDICNSLNAANRMSPQAPAASAILPGRLHLTMASSHLYERDFAAATACLRSTADNQNPVPDEYWRGGMVTTATRLAVLRETSPMDKFRWWDHAAPF